MKNSKPQPILCDLRILIPVAFVFVPLSLVYGGGYIDEDNRLVIGEIIIELPDANVDGDGNLALINRVVTAPEASVMSDGSLLVDGVIYPVPEQPGEEYASYHDWALAAFPNPDDRNNPEVSGPTADPLGLGMPNLIRYALGITDSTDIADRMPQIVFVEDDLGLRFPFISSRDDVRIQVVAGEDLIIWDEVLWDSMVHGGSAEPNTSWLQVTDSRPLDTSGTARFLKLRAIAVCAE